MAKKSDFTPQEWESLRDTPQLVMLSVATAGASGLFGSLKEAFAPAHTIVAAAKGSNELLRSICDREELQAAQQSIRASIKQSGDVKALREQLQTQATERAHQAAEILAQKASKEDLDAYRSLLVDIADRTAKAAKEGSFFGFGGEWVSAEEKTVIDKLAKALEVQTA
jgi:hypothetical protein